MNDGLRRVVVGGVLVAIMAVGAGLRLTGNAWDDGTHVHPDERYLSIVADAIEPADGLGEYLDVRRSPLSPYNTEQGRDYLYGTLPLFVTKLAAGGLGRDSYDELYLVGRRLGAVVDTITILLVFGIALLLLEPFGARRAQAGALLAAALYAATVTMIQHAHFFTTDVWLVCFGSLTFLLALVGLRRGIAPGTQSPAPVVLLVGAAFGLTVACKVSGAMVALPVGLALLARAVAVGEWAGKRRAAVRLAVEAGAMTVCGYATFRLVSPYTFAESNWLDVSVNASLREALARQADAVAGPIVSPPSYQWLLSSPVWTPLENLGLWQLGLPLAAAAAAGLALLAFGVGKSVRDWIRARGFPTGVELRGPVAQLMLVTFVAAVFFSFGTRYVHSGRYLLPLVPLLPVAAAWALAHLSGRAPQAWPVAAAALVLATGAYAVAFTGIYTSPNTRVAASAWFSVNVPAGATIANEHWDDPLPVGGSWIADGESGSEGFRGIELPVFDPDDPAKLRKLYEGLSRTDYYVLSSPRAWNTIGRLPDRFPLMTRFYDELFAGRLPFERVATFESYPSLLGLELRDRRAEEAFWVYDHPPVTIFRRTAPLDWDTFRTRLCPRPVSPHCGPAATR